MAKKNGIVTGQGEVGGADIGREKEKDNNK